MIDYDQRICGGLHLICIVEGSVYKRVVPYAMIASIEVLILKGLIYWDIFDSSNVFEHPYVYQIYTFVLGFVLVFRCNLAYQRFWEGRTCLELMSSKWSDAALQSIIFDNVANKPEMDRRAFRARILSLFSLLHATALARLQDCEQEIEVLEGVDQRDAVMHLNSTEVKDQVFMVFTWVQDTLIRRLGHGGLAVPAPICTRLFQELSNGMLGFNNAAKIHDTPFPFPYAQLITLALLILTFTCGFVMNVFVKSPFWAVLFTFVAIAGYYAINEVAIELEDPFGDDANDLPLNIYQCDYNNRLRPLLRLDEVAYRAPALDAEIMAMANVLQASAIEELVPPPLETLQAFDDDDVPSDRAKEQEVDMDGEGMRRRKPEDAGGCPLLEEDGQLQIKWVSNVKISRDEDEGQDD